MGEPLGKPASAQFVEPSMKGSEAMEIAARLDLGMSAVRHRFRKGSELYSKRLERALGADSAGAEGIARSGPPEPASDPALPEG